MLDIAPYILSYIVLSPYDQYVDMFLDLTSSW